MVQINNKRLREWSKGKMTDDVLEAHELFKEAFPRCLYPSVKDMINDSYRTLSKLVTKELTHRRIETIWQGTARRIDSTETAALLEAKRIRKLRRVDEARQLIEEDRREARELRARLAALDARLATTDPEFHGPSMEAYRAQSSGLGRVPYDGENR